MNVSFVMEKIENPVTKRQIDTVVKLTEKPDVYGVPTVEREEWCNVLELDKLFSTCVERWGNNWDLNKVCVAIAESEID